MNRIPCEKEFVEIEEKFKEKAFLGCIAFLECVHVCGNGLRKNGRCSNGVIKVENTTLKMWVDEDMYCCIVGIWVH